MDERTKNDRKDILMNDQYGIMQEKHEALIGQAFEVLVEGYDEYSDSYFGRTYRDAPEIDSVIRFTAPFDLNEGDFCTVKVFGIDEYDLIGEAEA